VSAYSDGLVAMINDYVHRGVAMTLPADLFYGLSTTEPANDGTNITEPADANYARQAVPRDVASFDATAARDTVSAVDVSWPASTGGGAGYGDVGWIPIFDALTVGTFLGYLTLDEIQNLTAGIGFDLPAGTATWTSAA
jgi:hypothetical protein